MSTAQKLLVGYGLIVLTYGFLLGVPLAASRAAEDAVAGFFARWSALGLVVRCG